MIKIEKIKKLCSGQFLSLQKIFFDYKGKKKSWEVCKSGDSVAVLLYHREFDSFLFVKQFRMPVFLKNGDGFTYELCAGLIDKDKSLIEIAKEEILEECGYDVPLSNIQKVTEFYSSVGSSGAKQILYYAELDENMKISEGGGIDDEDIEPIFIKIDNAKNIILDDTFTTTPGLKFALLWWFFLK
ncbi:UDP-sugar diphosphatase [Lebetimonas natsushimae]|uniref:UDP-sugar diphosphatase n=1 Tax=Lebetimonas natsushimae TaxID=1936991 RepID=A0A292YD14_9BACT|nr:NUDIX hydrolase [Lebetimonas natsushimae]GAX87313.1 UDP-sugar diphosphatase [Lebetimonas natsushimae]